WSVTADIATGDGQRLQTYYRRWSETADILQEMVRDCRHTTGDGPRDCRHTYGDGPETADILQVMVRDSRHTTREMVRTANRIQEKVTRLWNRDYRRRSMYCRR
ncbi:unnamed protein product, partial [Staurois parvus]